MRDKGSTFGRNRRALPGVAAIVVGGMLAASADASAATYPDAVLLVSGFDSASPFSTPHPSCNGKEGSGWNPTGGVAPTKDAGLNVFTAPVKHATGELPPTCTGPGEVASLDDAVIDSNGDVDANGRALATLLGFLRDEYGLGRVQIVGHSDGGLWSRSAITQNAPSPAWRCVR